MSRSKNQSEDKEQLREIDAEELKNILDELENWQNEKPPQQLPASLINRNIYVKRPTKLDEDLRRIISDQQINSDSKPSFELSDLDGANLRNRTLSGVVLRGAKLCGANLEHSILGKTTQFFPADLTDVDLSYANLFYANAEEASFDGANLWATKFLHANLCRCDFSKAKGLDGAIFGGSDLTSAKLPDDFKFGGLANASAFIKTAKTLLTILLVSCAYTLLATNKLNDKLILPVLNFQLNLSAFLLSVPLILFGVYACFLFSCQRVWENFARLPAIFPSGATIDQRTEPWALSGVARPYFFRLINRTYAYGWLETVVGFTLMYLVAPLTIAYLTWFSFTKNLWQGLSEGTWLVCAVATALIAWRNTKRTLCQE